ncbi:EamA-like transporter family protein [Nitrospirillum amazonense]|uniref:EamA-like transporter family protein n=1 Tax=Nitrospirillum amazonense TaxID=28077 RepID=A0A560JAT3_9PROT|nr:EamA family transporter [Nitrospirillum amazonense]TWB68303.1 EamA-like transporter family protein [Nitrospirillum amazonense]
MSIAVFAIVLFAALLHATWNALVKGAGDKLMAAVLVAGGAALIAIVTLPFLPLPAAASWPYLVTSSVLQILYLTLVARAYHVADMSQTYPLMRGTAPLLVALVSGLWLHEALSLHALLGVGVICAGILSMAWVGRRGGPGGGTTGTRLALLTAVVIAGYTLVDGHGVRLSGAPASYVLWGVLLNGVPLVTWALLARRRTFLQHVIRQWPRGLVGGAGTLISYGLALWAMTVAPVAVIAALRESSILFGTAIAGLVLKERVGPRRLAAACLIAVGAMVLRLA